MPNKRCFVRHHRVAEELLIVKRNSSCANRYEKPSSFCCGRIAPAIYRRRPRLKLRKTGITKSLTGSCTYFLAESRMFSYCASGSTASSVHRLIHVPPNHGLQIVLPNASRDPGGDQHSD